MHVLAVQRNLQNAQRIRWKVIPLPLITMYSSLLFVLMHANSMEIDFQDLMKSYSGTYFHGMQATFQERKKRVDALVYCLKDIFNYVDENLKLTRQICIELGTPSEEGAEKMERVSALHFKTFQDSYLMNFRRYPYLSKTHILLGSFTPRLTMYSVV